VRDKPPFNGSARRGRRTSWPSPALVVSIVALVLALAGGATAATLITGKQVRNGSLTGLDIKDKSLTAKDFKGALRGPKGTPGQTGPAGAPGQTGPAGPAPTCPTGTVLHEFACIETAQRPLATWFAARDACRALGRRLPSLSELTSFEQRTDSFVPTIGSEWADSWNVNTADPQATALRFTDGLVGAADADAPGGYNYRCVAPASVG
jgi:hypothetical protein